MSMICYAKKATRAKGTLMRRPYVKPVFRRAPHGLDFVLSAIRQGWHTVCRQCSSCHGCR
ncbi:MAG: hypothetical protein UU08_C0028G0009 [Candidatus Uhrbacteria bacterium GW2011_GWE2_40_58]|nr:MAG: hypothetical protein UT94_C0038G0009 [Candidatus Uhrbacteria bacterium GW2011_GWF2_40_263]KKR67077.1 MAG: hypothetical protein UU08_C0028G0009 [Candidatus Uhrbacteria bacterium GW2011_GWE2_40_58]